MRIILISSASATWIMRFSVEKEKKDFFHVSFRVKSSSKREKLE